MFYKVIGISVLCLFVSACSIKQTVETAELPRNSQLCVVENPDVREGFLREFKSVLNNRNISFKVVNQRNVPADCQWTATYVGRWSWDLALYMSYAEIKVYNNGSLYGEAIYDSTWGGANMGKFIDAEEKIRELLNSLLDEKSVSLFSRTYG